MENKEIQALYCIWKRQLIALYKESIDSSLSDGYVYAISRDCYPYLQESEESQIYEQCFKIQKDFFDKVVDKLNEIESTEKYCNFMDFRASVDVDKYDLIIVLRYIYLENRFDKKLWSSLITEDSSSEVKQITRVFDKSEISIFSN